KGQVIGYVGCTGSCTGPHLHFETRVDGAARDPRPYLAGGAVPGAPTAKAATRARVTASIRKDVVQARTAAKVTTLNASNGARPARRPCLPGGAGPGAPTVRAATRPRVTASIRRDVVQARTAAKVTTLNASNGAVAAPAPVAQTAPAAGAPPSSAPVAAAPA